MNRQSPILLCFILHEEFNIKLFDFAIQNQLIKFNKNIAEEIRMQLKYIFQQLKLIDDLCKSKNTLKQNQIIKIQEINKQYLNYVINRQNENNIVHKDYYKKHYSLKQEDLTSMYDFQNLITQKLIQQVHQLINLNNYDYQKNSDKNAQIYIKQHFIEFINNLDFSLNNLTIINKISPEFELFHKNIYFNQDNQNGVYPLNFQLNLLLKQIIQRNSLISTSIKIFIQNCKNFYQNTQKNYQIILQQANNQPTDIKFDQKKYNLRMKIQNYQKYFEKKTLVNSSQQKKNNEFMIKLHNQYLNQNEQQCSKTTTDFFQSNQDKQDKKIRSFQQTQSKFQSNLLQHQIKQNQKITQLHQLTLGRFTQNNMYSLSENKNEIQNVQNIQNLQNVENIHKPQINQKNSQQYQINSITVNYERKQYYQKKKYCSHDISAQQLVSIPSTNSLKQQINITSHNNFLLSQDQPIFQTNIILQKFKIPRESQQTQESIIENKYEILKKKFKKLLKNESKFKNKKPNRRSQDLQELEKQSIQFQDTQLQGNNIPYLLDQMTSKQKILQNPRISMNQTSNQYLGYNQKLQNSIKREAFE